MRVPPTLRRAAFIVVLLLSSAAAQAAWARGMNIAGARPDFVLLAAVLCSQFCGAIEGGVVGFSGGLLSASMADPFDGGFGSIVVSRTLICYGVGWLEERVFRDNAAIALALVSGGTLLAEGLFYAFDPHFPAARWGRGVLLEVAYNTCLAAPGYLVVRKCLRLRPEEVA